MKLKFVADGVKVRTGKPDRSAEVVLTVGEYMLQEIKDLVTVTDGEIKVEIEVSTSD